MTLSLPSVKKSSLLHSRDAMPSSIVICAPPPPGNRCILCGHDSTLLSRTSRLVAKRPAQAALAAAAPRQLREERGSKSSEQGSELTDSFVKQLQLQDTKVSGRTSGRMKIGAPPQVVTSVEEEKELQDLRDGAVKRRLARARHRDRSYGYLKTEEDNTSLSFLEHNAVKIDTARTYSARLEEFKIWLKDNGIKPLSISHLDLMIVESFEDLFFAGFNHDEGEKLLASVGHFSQQLGRRSQKLARASAQRAATLIEEQLPLLLQGLQQPHLPVALLGTKLKRPMPSRGFPATPGPQHA
jgi:hypothetical protein